MKTAKRKLDDLDRFIAQQLKDDPEFAEAYEEERRTGEIGLLLSRARQEAGLTQEELAKRTGTTRSVVCRWERQPVNLTIATLDKAAKALGRKLVIKLA
jgi:HTH-type transcriptional regulator / antitoxin HipB